MFISLTFSIYMFDKLLFQYYYSLVPLKTNAILMFMTNMFIVQKLHTLYNSPTDSYKRSCKQTCE